MLNPDFKDILSIFVAEDVDFLVVGAYALASHGYPKTTGDIDLWVRPSPLNAERVLRALAKFGAPERNLAPSDLLVPGTIFQIGVVPRRIDILTSIDGVEFEKAWDHRMVVQVEGIALPVLGRDELIRNKKAVGRLKDLADVEWLERNAPVQQGKQ